MADASIYVAVISASAAVLGAAVSAVSIAYQNGRQAKRNREQQVEKQQQRYEKQARGACLDLLRAAVDLRSQVENNEGYQGPEMRSRLAQVRQHASDAELHAVLIGSLQPDEFAELASKLAEEARNVAAAAAENTNLEMNIVNEVPNLDRLNDCIEAFSKRTVGYAKGETPLSALVVSNLHCDLAVLRRQRRIGRIGGL